MTENAAGSGDAPAGVQEKPQDATAAGGIAEADSNGAEADANAAEGTTTEGGKMSGMPPGAEAAQSMQSQTQQQQQDFGDVEQRRAMELLRSVDEEGGIGGQVIVCSAPDDNDDDSLLATPTPHPATAVAAATTGKSELAYNSLSSLDAAPTELHGAKEATATGTEAASPPGTADAAAGGEAQALGAEDSYIAQLTMKALEQEREDVLKVSRGNDSCNGHGSS